MEPLLRKSLSWRNFEVNTTLCIYKYTKNNHIQGETNTVSKSRPNDRFHFASFQFWRKFEKPFSQKNFSRKFDSY